MTNERQIAVEVWDEYNDTMSKIYYSYFKSYSSRLMKLQVRQRGREGMGRGSGREKGEIEKEREGTR